MTDYKACKRALNLNDDDKQFMLICWNEQINVKREVIYIKAIGQQVDGYGKHIMELKKRAVTARSS
jgi:hypothetical protein